MQTPNVNDVIDHLAAKLSVPAAHLWSVLVKQAVAQAIFDVVLVLILSGLLVAMWKTWRFIRAMEEGDERDLSTIGAVIAGGICALLCVIFIIISLQELVTCFVNPEYFALHEILASLSK